MTKRIKSVYNGHICSCSYNKPEVYAVQSMWPSTEDKEGENQWQSLHLRPQNLPGKIGDTLLNSYQHFLRKRSRQNWGGRKKQGLWMPLAMRGCFWELRFGSSKMKECDSVETRESQEWWSEKLREPDGKRSTFWKKRILFWLASFYSIYNLFRKCIWFQGCFWVLDIKRLISRRLLEKPIQWCWSQFSCKILLSRICLGEAYQRTSF